MVTFFLIVTHMKEQKWYTYAGISIKKKTYPSAQKLTQQLFVMSMATGNLSHMIYAPSFLVIFSSAYLVHCIYKGHGARVKEEEVLVYNIMLLFAGKLTESGSLDVLRAAVSSTVVAFLVISLLIFATGFVCGHYFGRKSKQPPTETPDHPSASQTEVPLYEDVTLSAVEQQEGLEMRENVAYGPL